LPRLPSEFNYKEKELAELWGSLTNRFPADKALLSELKKEHEDQEGLVLLTREEISELVAEAFQNQQQKIAKQLFELTNPVTKREKYTRKSMRIGQGEYLELLYLKINKETSFSDVIIDVLSEPLMRHVEEIETQYGDILSDSINNLKKNIRTWREDIPPPRSREVDYRFIPFKERTTPFREKKVELIEKVQEIAKTRGYLENLPHDIYEGPDEIYQEFRGDWESQIEDKLTKGFDLWVYAKEDKLRFKLYVEAFSSVDRIRLEELYQIDEFFLDPVLKKYCLYPYEEEFEEQWAKFENHHKKFTYIIENTHSLGFGILIDIGLYFAVIKSSKEFEVQIDQEFMDNIDKNLEKFQNEIFNELSYYKTEEMSDIIQKVMAKGDEAEYRLVSQLFSIGNVRKNMPSVIWAGRQMIEDLIAKYPAISYNVPDVIAPLLTLILKEQNLFDLIQIYKKKKVKL